MGGCILVKASGWATRGAPKRASCAGDLGPDADRAASDGRRVFQERR